ncbi:hypothetical protein BVX98_05040 [bacterium F11]|nr:hypothetical protein BVX98_05040 [bacterium F11]
MGGVGSRRWAKFSKFLANKGIESHVVTIEYSCIDKLNWSNDVDLPQIHVHRLKPEIPPCFLKVDAWSFSLRLFWFLYRKLFRRKCLDVADGWEKRAIPLCHQLIQKEGIRNVIFTGPPHSVNYMGTILKKENPSINVIQDYRDPWNSSRFFAYPSAIKSLSLKKRSLEMEAAVMEQADKVITVTRDMEANLVKEYPQYKAKVMTIHNGFDPDDYVNGKSPEALPREFNLIYAGIIGQSLEHRGKALERLAEAIDQLNDDFFRKNLRINIYSDVSIDLFGDSPYFDIFSKVFNFHGFVSPAELSIILQQHAYCLSINAPKDPHAFGTKIFDYMAIKKRIFLISNGGELAGLLKENNQFVASYDTDSIKEQLLLMKKDFISPHAEKVDYSQFNLSHLTQKLESTFL